MILRRALATMTLGFTIAFVVIGASAYLITAIIGFLGVIATCIEDGYRRLAECERSEDS